MSDNKKEQYYDIMVRYLVPHQGVITLSAIDEATAEELCKKHMSYYTGVEIEKITLVSDIPEHPLNNPPTKMQEVAEDFMSATEHKGNKNRKKVIN